MKMIHGDCLDEMGKMKDKSVDLIFYDPPYNKKKKYDNYDDNLSMDDYLNWMEIVFHESERIAKRGVIVYIGGLMTFDFHDFMPNSHLIIVHKRAVGAMTNNYFLQYHSMLSTAKPIKKCKDLWSDIRLPGEGYYFREPRYDTPGLTGLELTKIHSISPPVFTGAHGGPGMTCYCFVYCKGTLSNEHQEEDEEIESFALTFEEIKDFISSGEKYFGSRTWLIVDAILKRGKISFE